MKDQNATVFQGPLHRWIQGEQSMRDWFVWQIHSSKERCEVHEGKAFHEG